MTSISNDGITSNYIDDTLIPRTYQDIKCFVEVLSEMVRYDMWYYLEKLHTKPNAIFIRESDYETLMTYWRLYANKFANFDINSEKPIKFCGMNIYKTDVKDNDGDKLYWFGF